MAPSTQPVPRSQHTHSPIFPHNSQGMCRDLSIPGATANLPPSRQQRQSHSGHPSPAVTSWSGLPLQSGGGFAEPIPVPPRSPHTRGPRCPRILQHSRLKHPAGGWERLAALPRRFSFIKHKAGGGFSQAVSTAESLFSAASGRKMEGGQETGRPLPLFSFQGGKRTGWGV